MKKGAIRDLVPSKAISFGILLLSSMLMNCSQDINRANSGDCGDQPNLELFSPNIHMTVNALDELNYSAKPYEGIDVRTFRGADTTIVFYVRTNENEVYSIIWLLEFETMDSSLFSELMAEEFAQLLTPIDFDLLKSNSKGDVQQFCVRSTLTNLIFICRLYQRNTKTFLWVSYDFPNGLRSDQE